MKFKIVMVVLVLTILLGGCAQQPLSIKEVYLCKSVNENNSPLEMPNILPADIKNIYLSVNIENITPEDELKVAWTYLDTGDVIQEQVSRVDKKGSGYLSFNINISEGFPSGNYQAEVFLNGELFEELEFSVK
ncbi:MAG: hypothetical protein PHN32_08905 [Actinomycetota bacterium]|jgi:PBP1b-binding outer membrane lipoprotein LpoB|nr:hypothetical protein [Actinomycetota bacterium]